MSVLMLKMHNGTNSVVISKNQKFMKNNSTQYFRFSFHKKKDHRRTFLEETLLFCRDTVNFVFIFRESIKKPLLLLCCGLQCAKTCERCRLQSSTPSPCITRFPLTQFPLMFCLLTYILSYLRVSEGILCYLSYWVLLTGNLRNAVFSRNQN